MQKTLFPYLNKEFILIFFATYSMLKCVSNLVCNIAYTEH